MTKTYRTGHLQSFLKISIVLASLTLLGRFLGLARESIIAAKLGLTQLTDAVLLFLTLPDFLVSLLLIGGINAALIPALKSQNKHVAYRMLGNSFVLVISLVTFVGVSFAVSPEIPFSILAPSLDFNQIPNFQNGLRILPCIILLACFIALINAVLVSNDHFYFTPLSVIIFNMVLISYFFFIDSTGFNMLWFAFVFLFAIFFRLLLLLRPAAPFVRSTKVGALQEQKKYWRVFAIGFMAFGTFAIAPTAFRSIYAAQGDGFLAIFNFANKLFELPMGLIVGTISTILLPHASGLVAKGHREFDEVFTNVLRATFTLAVIALLLTSLFVPYYIELLFEHGVLDKNDINQISRATKTMFIGAPFAAVSLILIVNLNARDCATKIIYSLVPSLLISLLFAKGLCIPTFGSDQSIIGLNLFYFLSCSCLLFFSFPKTESLKTIIKQCTLDVIPIMFLCAPLFLFVEKTHSVNMLTGILLSVVLGIVLCTMKLSLFRKLSEYKI